MERKLTQDTANTQPPPYTPATISEEEAFLNHVMTTRRRQNEDEVATQAAACDAETDRLRNMLMFTLSIDYQCDVGTVALPASDRNHFLTLDNLLADLEQAHDKARPSNAERSQLAPYFWKSLHKPCKALAVPVEIVLAKIWQLRKFVTIYGKYKGCCFGILQTSGLGALARKLYLDKTVVIPALFEPGPLRRRMLDGVEEISQLYFDEIHGFDGSTMTTDGWRNRDSVQTIRYDANERGSSYEELRNSATTAGCLSMAHLTLIAKRCVSAIFDRHVKVDAGVRSKDPDLTWQGDGHLLPKDRTSGRCYQYWGPVDWTAESTYHLPDFYEN